MCLPSVFCLGFSSSPVFEVFTFWILCFGLLSFRVLFVFLAGLICGCNLTWVVYGVVETGGLRLGVVVVYSGLGFSGFAFSGFPGVELCF